MKKIIMFLMLSLLGITQMVAQEYEYVPFVREGVKWVYIFNEEPFWKHTFTLEMKGDAEINGKTYKVMHKYSGEEINWEDDTIPVYLREDNKVVYGIVPDGKTYPECPVGIEGNQSMMEKIAAGEEFILYDFNNPVEFVEGWLEKPSYYWCSLIPDMTTVGGKSARRFISFNNFCFIEGVGYDGLSKVYPIAIQKYTLNYVKLVHVVENGEVIYSSESNNVNPSGMIEPILPLAREGVKWVNEHVTIDNGDTTRYYYSYEFNGVNYRNHPRCYYYTGSALDLSTAVLSANFEMYGYDDDVRHSYYVYNNPAFEKVVEEGRNMMGYGSPFSGWYAMYQFSETHSAVQMTNTVNYHIFNQRGDYLNRENFVEVEPLTIEGMTCRRYAYLDDNGEPLAYITEGIGFDSRDMGDLLTPFTLKPDPDADHQEYWGLSHVIKDGEIIYKGMRYHEEGADGLEGDVNGDGTVTIADVSALIDLLLESTPKFKQQCDVNGDGALTIGDVSTLIDKLLSAN